MKLLIRDFRRLYHKIRAVHSQLAAAGGRFRFEMKFEAKFGKDVVEHTQETPDDAETVRFVALMRRFLYPPDDLYYKKIWTSLQLRFGLEISDVEAKKVESLIKSLEKGTGEISFNDDKLTPEKIYQTISDGGFFDNDMEAMKYLEGLVRVPIMGPLLRYQFYDYSLRGFEVVSALFDVILRVEHNLEAEGPEEREIDTNLCIYCLETEGSFNSEEHVIAESLGNDEVVLPRGFVCDCCNNGVLSELDSALLKFEPIAWAQVMYVPHTKAGRFPKAKFSSFDMERVGPRHIKMTPKNKAGEIRDLKQIGDDLHSFKVEWKGKKINWKLIGRALYKIALGMVAFKQGREQARDRKFDSARKFIREGKGIENNLLMLTRVKPHASIQTKYFDWPEGTPFFIDFFGLVFFLNLENAPIVRLDDELEAQGFQLFSLGDTDTTD